MLGSDILIEEVQAADGISSKSIMEVEDLISLGCSEE